ncbi:porin [Amylibacter sp.]|nr:porin [Amylibacter sp.]
MKKLLIATTALVATAGMASADITITGHAAAGVYSGLSNKDATAAVKLAVDPVIAVITAAQITAHEALTNQTDLTNDHLTANESDVNDVLAELVDDRAAAVLAHAKNASPTAAEVAFHTAELASFDAMIALAQGTAGIASAAATVGTYSGDGIYSNAGVDFTMSGTTDNGITFSAAVNVDAGMEIDAGDFELDGKDGGTAGLGSVSMTGAFGTLTFDDGGIENLYSDSLTNADVSYSTTVGAVSLTVAHDTAAAGTSANSVSAGYSASGMDFTLTASEAKAGTSTKLAVAYALNDTVSLSGKSDQAAGKESVQTIGATTTLNGVSVSVESANNSTWDVDLGYTAGGFALTYGVDETDGWTATATAALGGGATFAAGVNDEDSMYAGVSFAF